ncbi:hypothetical protein ACLB2K_000382 [Fragaria x ananassa]
MEEGVKCYFCPYTSTGNQTSDVQHLQAHGKVRCCVCGSYYPWNQKSRLEAHYKGNRDHCRAFVFCYKTDCLIRIHPNESDHKCITPKKRKLVGGEGDGTSDPTDQI